MFDVNFLPASAVLPVAEQLSETLILANSDSHPEIYWPDDVPPPKRLDAVSEATLILPDDHTLPPPPSK